MNRDVFFNIDENTVFNAQIENQENEIFVSSVLDREINLPLDTFIGSQKENGNSVKFLFSNENNSSLKIKESTYQNVLDYNSEIISKNFEQMENKFNSFVSLRENARSIHNKLLELKKEFSDFIEVVEKDYNENINRLQSDRFENILFEENKKSEGVYFNNISKYFVDKKSKYINDKFQNQKENISLINLNEVTSNKVDIVETNTLKNNLINIENKLYDINTCNDIVTQVAVNLSRSFYTLSNNSFIGNYEDNNKIAISYNFERYKVLTSDRKNNNILSSIDIQSDILNIQALQDKLQPIDASSEISNITIDANLKSSVFNSEKFYLGNNNTGFLDTISSFYLNNTWRDFIINPLDESTFQNINEKSFVDEVKLIFSQNENNNLFNFNLNDRLGVRRVINVIYDKIDNFINNQDIDNSASNSPLKKLKEIFEIHNEYKHKVIFVNENPIVDVNVLQSTNSGIISIEGTTESSLNRNFSIDLLEDFDDIEYKIKLDNLLKTTKRKRLQNENIDLDIFKELISKSNSYENQKMVAYCKDSSDRSEVSIIDENNKLFDLFFTKDSENSNKVYSNTDVYSSHNIDNINFVGIKNRKDNNIPLNVESVSERENIKKLIDNYYPKNCFFSTTSLFQKINQDISLNNFSLGNSRGNNIEKQNCQAFYLNVFSPNSNVSFDYKKVIARRFFKKSLFLSSKASHEIKNLNFSDYTYDFEKFDIEDYKTKAEPSGVDFVTEENLKSFMNDILSTSKNLNKIKKSVFTKSNIDSVSSKNKISSFNNFNLRKIQDVGGESREIMIEGLSQKTNIFPGYSLYSIFQVVRNLKEDLVYNSYTQSKNNIIPKPEIFSLLTYNPFNPYSNYIFDPESIDITTSSRIKLRYYIESIPLTNRFREANNQITNNNKQNNYIEIVDLFDEIYEIPASIFYRISNTIIEALSLTSSTFKNASFNSEEDVDAFIEEHIDFLEDEVFKILNIYSEIFLPYYNRFLRSISFADISSNNYKYGTDLNIDQIPSFGKLVRTNIANSDFFITNDFDKVFAKIEESVDNSNSILQSEDVYNNNLNSKVFSSFSKKIDNLYRSFYISDFYQAYMFDILNGFIHHQEVLNNRSISDISYNISNIELYQKFITDDLIDLIREYFFNNLFFSNVSKNLLEKTYKNSKVISNIIDRFENEEISAYENNFFDFFNDLKQNYIEKAKNITFDNNSFSLNSSFYTFGLHNEELNNINENSLIKFTISLVDKFNVNHVYLPKILYFSPLIFDTNFLLQGELLNIDSENCLGLYSFYEDLKDKTKISNIEDVKNIQESSIKSAIRNKITNDEEDVEIIYQHLLNCHVNNNKIKLFLHYMYNIKKDYSTEISDFKNLIEEKTSNKEFYNIFNKQKKYIDDNRFEDFYEKISLSLDSLFDLQNSFDSYYELYHVSVDTKDFIYYDISDNSSENVTQLDSEYLSLIRNEINEEVLNNNPNRIKTSNLKLDNMSVNIKVEIL